MLDVTLVSAIGMFLFLAVRSRLKKFRKGQCGSCGGCCKSCAEDEHKEPAG